MITKLFDLLPGWAWFLICVFLALACVGLNVQLANAHAKISEEIANVAKEQKKFLDYEAKVQANQAVAVAKQREIELHNFRNSERIAYEQERRDKAYADQLAQLRSRDQRMRNELDAFRAAAAGDAQRGDVARLAARADLATGLYAACREEYRSMAAEAEQLRRKAVGLFNYIKGNSMCSRPFGAGAAEPAD